MVFALLDFCFLIYANFLRLVNFRNKIDYNFQSNCKITAANYGEINTLLLIFNVLSNRPKRKKKN